MEFQSFINILKMTLLIDVIIALVILYWVPLPVQTHLSTVSWNG